MNAFHAISVAIVVLLAGCPSSMGSTDSSDDTDEVLMDMGSSDGSPADAFRPPPDPDVASVGLWVGYIEGPTLESGSDTITVNITDESASGALTAWVSFGDSVEPPPPTDPDLGYPTDWRMGRQRVYESFHYSAPDATLSRDRVQLGISTYELWYDWCEILPVFETDGRYACLPNWGYSTGETGCTIGPSPEGEVRDVDCAKLELCDLGGVCECDASGCRGRMGEPDIRLDFSIEGDEADGTIVGLNEVPLRFRLFR